MNTRRVRLTAAVGAVFLLMVNRRVEAYDPTHVDVEVQGHGGTGSGQVPVHQGGCLFAPTSAIRYGGGGARVRWRPQATAQNPHHGVEVSGAAVVEHHSFETLAEGSRNSNEAPDAQVFGGGALGVTYNWRWVGVRGGSLAYTRIPHATIECAPGETNQENCRAVARYASPTVAAWPDLNVRIGPLNTLHGELGAGAYNLATVMRPGLYAGLAWGNADGWEVAARVGAHNTFGNEAQFRGDLSVRVPVHRNLRLGAGGALTAGDNDRVEPEGRLSGELRF